MFRSALCAILLAALVSVSCQDYPFEFREAARSDAKQISELVATLTPADILFVIDNSGSMEEEINELQANLDRFVLALSESDNDFQLGIITTDMECNTPAVNGNCSLPNPTASVACCDRRAKNPDTDPCREGDDNGDGVVDSSTCDGGRLRSATPNGRRIFARPEPADRSAFVAEVRAAIDAAKNNLMGSTLEAGLAAATTAVACAVGDASCPDQAIADLNAGFIRDEADLVIIFLSDEDDCSANASTYLRPNDYNDSAQMTTRFCGALDCYAYYGDGDTDPTNNVHDFIDSGNLFCVTPSGPELRQFTPPSLRGTDLYLDELIALKDGDVGRVRAAGILSATAEDGVALGFSANGCYGALSGPSSNCGCVSGSGSPLYCEVTAANGQLDAQIPDRGGAVDSGCDALPGGRYVEFLRSLAVARSTAGHEPDTLVDSICLDRYDETLDRIVNNVIISNCFDLGDSYADPSKFRVTLNDAVVPNVTSDSDTGWSLAGDGSQICLRGGLTKKINDRFNILVLTSEAGAAESN